jgi:hypothetical protein
MGGICEVRPRDKPSWCDVHTQLRGDRFRHSSSIAVITATIWDAATLVLLIVGIYEIHLRDGFMWHDVRTKIHED